MILILYFIGFGLGAGCAYSLARAKYHRGCSVFNDWMPWR